ncbi:uncharacterized protein G2W53_015404 [Senna tora]|uniref:Uncharacterized protein n=1 Tax=Senna tora TaxID=362788 RepID=A0A835C811_9FABA|nr:uncharacterized protein G2W53_015404 [Senna tora]
MGMFCYGVAITLGRCGWLFWDVERFSGVACSVSEACSRFDRGEEGSDATMADLMEKRGRRRRRAEPWKMEDWV